MQLLPRIQGIFGGTYAIPSALAVVSGAGLLFALVGDHGWDLASWVMLGAPILIAGWFWLIPATRSLAR
jgi:hypothetical protein